MSVTVSDCECCPDIPDPDPGPQTTPCSGKPTGQISTLDTLTESSSMAHAWADDRIYTANDDPDQTIYIAQPSTGNIKGTIKMAGSPLPSNSDVEALFVDTAHRLWVGDVGNASHGVPDNRTNTALYRSKNAVPTSGNSSQAFTRYPLRFQSGARPNIEAFVISPLNQWIYLFEKRETGSPRLYRLKQPGLSTSMNLCDRIKTLAQHNISDATVSKSGRFFYLRQTEVGHTTVLDAFTFEDVYHINDPHTVAQGESITTEPDGCSLLFGSEGSHSPIVRANIPLAYR